MSKALEQTGRWALARYSARGKGYLVVIRPLGKGLVMQQLYYANEVRSMNDLDIGEAQVKENELKMAVQLAEMGAAEEFRPEQYRDEVSDRVRELINQKVQDGAEITATPSQEPRAQVIDLMEALKASLGNPRTAAPARTAAKVTKMPIKTESKRKPAKAAASKTAAAKRTVR